MASRLHARLVFERVSCPHWPANDGYVARAKAARASATRSQPAEDERGREQGVDDAAICQPVENRLPER